MAQTKGGDAVNTTYRFTFRPLDGWRFSDGLPFNQDDEGLTIANSIFPPKPHIPVAAIRVRLAKLLGWKGSGHWQTKITNEIGDGMWNIGRLRFSNFCLCRESSLSKNLRRYVPLPRFFYKDANTNYRRMTQTRLDANSDLGANPPVFEMEGHQLSQGDDFWWSEDPTAGVNVSGVESPSNWFVKDRRIGIQLNSKTKVTEDGMLFALSKIRTDGNLMLSIDMTVSAAGDDELNAKLGKEGCAPCELGSKGGSALLKWTRIEPNSSLQFTGVSAIVVTRTPSLITSRSDLPTVNNPWPGFSSAVVSSSACDRLDRFSAWDYNTNRSDWVWVLPAGASYQIELPENDAPSFIKHLSDNGLNSNLNGMVSSKQIRNLGFGEVQFL